MLKKVLLIIAIIVLIFVVQIVNTHSPSGEHATSGPEQEITEVQH